jgi:hypothetical protein
MIEILNQFILPKFVNNTTSFKKLHSIIYSGALTIIRLNGSKEIGQTNNIKTKELPKWEQRLNKRINNIRRDLGRITQYLKGINSNHLIVIYTISGIKAILQDSSVKIADDEGVSPSSSVITRVSCNML